MTLKKNKDWSDDLAMLEALLPSSKQNLRRISAMMEGGECPKIAAFGKYNHGKSTLLNALVGKEVFKVADKRETTEVSEFNHDSVIWIDTPGLDADVQGVDDKRAMTAALESADILCLVHNVKAGELDRSEMQLYRKLMKQDRNYSGKMMLVLSQIDQVTPENLEDVENEIRRQLPDLQIFSVSSLRYTRGIQEGKDGFIKASGMKEFLEFLEELKNNIGDTRRREGLRLVRKARVELKEMINHRNADLESAVVNLEKHEKDFWSDFDVARKKIMKRTEDLGLV
ncbi:GTPase [Alcanivorax sp.]|uniref:GTPase n=1 Tax=Alcanivorax sp. TaxID=1872427 RepID=UPI0025B8D25F|nr:GTPase [Alcanivorax sp.]